MDNHFPGPAEHIIGLIGDQKNDISIAIATASASYGGLYGLLGIEGFNQKCEGPLREGNLSSEMCQKGANLEYFLKMMETYATSNPSERTDRMKGFADDNQKPFSEIEKVLSHLGLPI